MVGGRLLSHALISGPDIQLLVTSADTKCLGHNVHYVVPELLRSNAGTYPCVLVRVVVMLIGWLGSSEYVIMKFIHTFFKPITLPA